MPKKKRIRTEYMRKYHKEHPRDKIKQQAGWLIRNNIKYGKLKRLPCVVCGNKTSEAHHQDYNKPFDIIWLCKTHHEQLHHYNHTPLMAQTRRHL